MITGAGNRAHEQAVGPAHIFLANNSILSVNQDAGCTEIACLAGSIWITRESDAVDHVLASGDLFHSRTKGLIVLWAMSDSQVTIKATSISLQRAAGID